MAKESGLGANFYLDGNDLSGDVGSLSVISKSMDTIEATGIDKSAKERLPGQLDGEISFESFWNPVSGEHAVLRNPPRTDRIATYFHRPFFSVPACSLVCKQVNYDPKRGSKGELNLNTQTLANAWWLDWGYTLTAGKKTDGAPANGTGFDYGSILDPLTFNFGAQFYLQVFAFTGTSATIKLQGSSDNAVGDPYADITGGAFAAVSSAPQSQRIQTARNLAMERWVRVVTTGTFSNLVFAVMAVFNQTDMTKL